MTQSSSSSSSGKVVDRFVFLPLISFIGGGGGCNSHSSIQVDHNATDHDEQRRRPPLPTKSLKYPGRPLTEEITRRDEEEDDLTAGRGRRGGWSSAVAWCGTENKIWRSNNNDNKSNGGGGSVKKLGTSIKTSLSQLFAVNYKQSGEEEEELEEEKEMEIGFPTDVKHVTHIGLDGTTKNNPTATATKGLDAGDDWMDSLKKASNTPADQIISFPTISLKQFELAMSAQAHGHTFNQHLA